MKCDLGTMVGWQAQRETARGRHCDHPRRRFPAMYGALQPSLRSWQLNLPYQHVGQDWVNPDRIELIPYFMTQQDALIKASFLLLRRS